MQTTQINKSQIHSKRLALPIALFLLAATLIGRGITLQNTPYPALSSYENWHGPMPFQARCLLVPVLRWGASNVFLIRASRFLSQSSSGPDQLLMQIIDVLSLFCVGALMVRLRGRMRPGRIFPWLTPFLLLWAAACTYAIRYEQRVYSPYDLTALFFFTAGLVACVESQAVLFFLIMLVGTYNRETTLFLLPIWAAANWNRPNLQRFGVPTLCFILWVGIKLQIRHWMHDAPSGLVIAAYNWKFVVVPHHWAQVASLTGFLIWPVIAFRKLVHDPMLKRLWLGYIPYIGMTLLMGWWNETRVFGELIPLVVVTAAVEFEQYLLNVMKPIDGQISLQGDTNCTPS